MAKQKRKSTLPEQREVRPSKQERLFQNILNTTQQFMQGKGFSPLTEAELLHRLSFPPQHAELLREVLHLLLKQQVVQLINGRYSLKKRDDQNIAIGTLRVHPRGFGFLIPDNATLYPEDIFIPKHQILNAVDGDKVEVQVNREHVSEKGPEGKVVTILTRGRTQVAGIIRTVERKGDIVAHVPLLGNAQRVVVHPSSTHDLRVGDRLIMEVEEWGSKTTPTLVRMVRHIGHISDPSCDIPAAIEEYELRSTFPSKSVEEAKAIGERVAAEDMEGREDLRELETFTIDPDTAKDFDDALSLSKDKAGNYHLVVHIADVSHYVKPGTALDEEALQRCNSTYFPGYCLPMLPPALSDNLCSLKPNVNRLTVSVFIDIDPKGEVIHYRINRSVIKSAKRFTYREAKEVLDGKVKSKHAQTLHLMVELCGVLKRKRYERGSIEFALPDLVILVDEQGTPYKTDYIAYDITHQLVEEFMLKANEIVATHISKQGKNLTFRIHDEPAEENMREFAQLAGAFGYRLSDKPTPDELQKLFDEALDTAYGQYLATSYIRRMRLAMYSADNIGHYGLGLTYYCHFTSPIRRYVDLVAHRVLFGGSHEREVIEEVASRCSDQERVSAKAENAVVLLKKLRLLKEVASKDAWKQYEAIVTRVKNFGIFFEVIDYMLEGFLHLSQLENDYYVFDEATLRLRGTRTSSSYSAGDRITVMLKGVDLISLESEWNLVSANPREPTHRVPSKPARQPPRFAKSRKKPTAAPKVKQRNAKSALPKRSTKQGKKSPRKK